jgi:hypothetical protein
MKKYFILEKGFLCHEEHPTFISKINILFIFKAIFHFRRSKSKIIIKLVYSVNEKIHDFHLQNFIILDFSLGISNSEVLDKLLDDCLKLELVKVINNTYFYQSNIQCVMFWITSFKKIRVIYLVPLLCLIHSLSS